MPDRHAAFLAVLRADGVALLAAAKAAPQAPIGACPGWDNTTLVRHMGRLWHYVSRQSQTTEPLSSAGVPPEGLEPVVWAEAGLQALLTALGQTDPQAPSWNWAPGEPDTAAFWFRRMAQETAVHRWDAQAAAGDAPPIESWLAADGIEEVMTMWLPTRRRKAKETEETEETPVGTVHLHAADPTPDLPSEWFVELGADGAVVCRHAHEKGDGVLRGSAHDILLRLWGRPSNVEEFGDPVVLSAMLAE